MDLPYSDELNIGALSRLFDNTSNCYKFFWFLAILRKNDGHTTRFSFEELVNEMIADAWYMVTECNLHLGPVGVKDNLEEAVRYIHDKYKFMSSEKREKILKFLKNSPDPEIKKYKQLLILNVPYRLQVPFYDEISVERSLWYKDKQALCDRINEQQHLIYYFLGFSGLSTCIEISDKWAGYLYKHREILKAWMQLKLILYLQTRNPSVPGIAEKLEPPAARDIARVSKYWKLVIQLDSTIKDIYGHVDLAGESISIDHFVPWQYVAHDELWNLHPTTRSINSSKSNYLPVWDEYFDLLSTLEYKAYMLNATSGKLAKEFDQLAKYHLNNQNIRSELFYADGLEESEFRLRLGNVLRPVYDAARMQGFKEWRYEDNRKENE